MYIDNIGIKEINQYYAQHGGRRSPNIKNFANIIENAKAGRISAANALAAARADTAAPAANSTSAAGTKTAQSAASRTAAARAAASHTTAHASRQTNAGQETVQDQADSPLSDTADSKNACCDKCQLTNELMLRMLSNNLYTQSGLGYSAMGSGALAAYQSLSKYFGNGVFA